MSRSTAKGLGTDGVPCSRAAETAAVRSLLGSHTPRVPISSIKSMLGHTLGAAGAIEAAASVLSIVHGMLPPTAQLQNPDPAFGSADPDQPGSAFDFVLGATRLQPCGVVLSSSFAFGGNNAALLFAQPA